MAPESITSLDTVTPISENISPVITTNTTSEMGTQTITDSISTVTTVLPIPPVNVEFVPNPDVIMQVADVGYKGFYYIDKASALADFAGLAFM
jgi:hypothetical protein